MKKSVIKNNKSALKKATTATLLMLYLTGSGFAGYKFGEAVKSNRAHLQGNVTKAVNTDELITPFVVGSSLIGAVGALAVGADMLNDNKKKADNSLRDFAKHIKAKEQDYDGLGRS